MGLWTWCEVKNVACIFNEKSYKVHIELYEAYTKEISPKEKRTSLQAK